MKFLSLLTILAATVAAVELDPRPRRRPTVAATRPQELTGNRIGVMSAARVPTRAPSGYSARTDKTSVSRDKASLKQLPAEYATKLRRDLSLMEKRQNGPDFYECTNSNPVPKLSDCEVVTDAVYDTNQSLIVTQNGCLVFQYQTCKGFFCALCSNVQSDTNFIGNQLNTAESLCVADGKSGAVVAERPPQWDSGFVHSSAGLPTYNVC